MSPEKNCDGAGHPLHRDDWCDKVGHCWHISCDQHTIDQHRDDVCCYCGARRCVSVPATPRFGVGTHGMMAGRQRGEMVGEHE